MSNFEAAILGSVFGYLIAQISIAFFGDEIFDAMDYVRYKVRRLFGLDKS